MKRDMLYDVIYLKDTLNGFALDPIPILCRVDYKTALETKSDLVNVYNPDRIVVWKTL